MSILEVLLSYNYSLVINGDLRCLVDQTWSTSIEGYMYLCDQSWAAWLCSKVLVISQIKIAPDISNILAHWHSFIYVYLDNQ